MEKLIKNLSIWGAVFVIIFGSALHFFYGWSGNNFIVGLFAPVNESLWEHMKLVFTPIMLFGLIDYYYTKIYLERAKRVERPIPLSFALLKQIGLAIVIILAIFYSYTHFTGHSILAVDISSFVIAIILAKWFSYKILTRMFSQYQSHTLNFIYCILLLIVTAFFIYATFNPPHINLFQDPNSSSYGIYEIK